MSFADVKKVTFWWPPEACIVAHTLPPRMPADGPCRMSATILPHQNAAACPEIVRRIIGGGARVYQKA